MDEAGPHSSVERSDAQEKNENDGSPLLWKLKSSDGKFSYLLADSSYVSYGQLVPEVIDIFEQSSELVLEKPSDGYIDWVVALEPNLEKEIGSTYFQKLLIEVPMIPVEFLQKMPAAFLVPSLSVPNRSTGPSIETAFHDAAEKKSIPIRYLVTDSEAYYSAFLDVMGTAEDLQRALDNPGKTLKQNKKRRWGYLQGDSSALGTSAYSDNMIQVLERENETWLPPMIAAVERGGAFIVVSATDLLSPNGLLRRLQERGIHAERALPGIAPSTRQPTIQSLRTSECSDAFMNILKYSTPEAYQQLTDNLERLQSILMTDPGRNFLSICRRQTTAWHDCISDAQEVSELSACDSKFPLEN